MSRTLCLVLIVAITSSKTLGLGLPQQQLLQPDGSLLNPISHDPSGRFLHLTDIHLDIQYKVGSAVSSGCHRFPTERDFSDLAGFYGAPGSNCDSPAALVNGTFHYIKEVLMKNDHGIDFVIWTGDNVRHSRMSLKVTDAEIETTNRIVTSHILDAFADPANPGCVSMPVVASIGNNDFRPHNYLKYSQESQNPTLNFFADLWAPFIPRLQDATFRRIGSYKIDLAIGKLWGVSLNTLYLSSLNFAVPDCRHRNQHSDSPHYVNTNRDGPRDRDARTNDSSSYGKDEYENMSFFDELTPGDDVLAWLEMEVLIPAQNQKISVYISGHIPPNVVNYSANCYLEFSRLTFKYRDVIRGQFYGHMNIDHFFFTTPDQVLRRYMSAAEVADVSPVNADTEETPNALIHIESETHELTKPPESVGIMSPSWILLYFEYLILHFKTTRKSDVMPQPIFVSPSVVPIFNPAIRLYIYETRSQGVTTPELGHQRSIPFPVYATLLDYEQYYSDLNYWNALWDIQVANSSDAEAKESIKRSNGRTPHPKYLFELEYTCKSLYKLPGYGIDVEAWLELAQRLGGNLDNIQDTQRKGNIQIGYDAPLPVNPGYTMKPARHNHKKRDQDTPDNEKQRDDSNTDQDYNETWGAVNQLRRLFFANMVVHLDGILFPFVRA
ncbi:hypothetical protein BASA50_004615 [Batrachochytrium salamandrivorans]|uniref:Calcineurin-like phosphoesterase domain-containing protein n=1 Tax=Batrachochytrium salamandrivorans TaxID=1357716 RepID=A0ABQ8FF59_9FUNG|nr:hypothetical protein BASA62_008754 [Batrachochytrium salamandrivorans]KAH6574849.1 hypothetical protein BASA60_005320 [Batrachochytrium salamandrivorans]KAH6597264.1 hypothetical protein BASA50_004615 [Batrachochytrium salamandrivorans]KAH9268177.1 hypothetical protein BASA84_000372 [Batrachochytrium salamandrivorans]KAH9277101.1 hypothetical protein BASA83_000625 [Batrachochytrium salamandrivorans]